VVKLCIVEELVIMEMRNWLQIQIKWNYSRINEVVRKIFVVTNIYKVVTYCYNLSIVNFINYSYIIV